MTAFGLGVDVVMNLLLPRTQTWNELTADAMTRRARETPPRPTDSFLLDFP